MLNTEALSSQQRFCFNFVRGWKKRHVHRLANEIPMVGENNVILLPHHITRNQQVPTKELFKGPKLLCNFRHYLSIHCLKQRHKQSFPTSN